MIDLVIKNEHKNYEIINLIDEDENQYPRESTIVIPDDLEELNKSYHDQEVE